MEVITVSPSQGQWTVHRQGQPHRQTYLSGATAEAAARQLGAALARHGVDSEIRIFLRDGSLAGVVRCPAVEAALA
jgi:hypothetical protein